jgi:hypothetical protein
MNLISEQKGGYSLDNGFNYGNRRPTIGEILIVPLTHPNGAYIRMENDTRIPILAKVRSIFSDTVNVINIFGYIYNVPISNTQPVNLTYDSQYYVDLVNYASQIMHSLGYKILDNSEFYAIPSQTSYPFLPYLPGYQSNIYLGQNVIVEDVFTPLNGYEKDGQIYVMSFNKKELLHVIDKSFSNILFDSKSGELFIKGYGYFLIDSSYTYSRSNSSITYVILRSDRNYIHIAENNIMYTKIPKAKFTHPPNYRIKTLELSVNDIDHQKFFDIIRIINNEFD